MTDLERVNVANLPRATVDAQRETWGVSGLQITVPDVDLHADETYEMHLRFSLIDGELKAELFGSYRYFPPDENPDELVS